MLKKMGEKVLATHEETAKFNNTEEIKKKKISQ